MIKALSLVTVYVRDVQEAIDFYRDTLGLEGRSRITLSPERQWVTVGVSGQPDVEIALLQPEGWYEEQTAARLMGKIGEGSLCTFTSDDCQADYKELLGRGVVFRRPPTKQPYGLEAVFEDLYGNPFTLLQPAEPPVKGSQGPRW